MTPGRFLSRFLPLLAGGAGLAAGWWLASGSESAVATVTLPTKSSDRPADVASGRGAVMLADWAGRVAATPDAGIAELAAELTEDPRRNDAAAWMPLIARWSESDPAGMIAFLESSAPSALRAELIGCGWFAWGAADPDVAFAAGRKLKPEVMRKLLEGVAETDPAKAAEFIPRVPDSQFMAWSFGEKILREAPEAAAALMKRAVYDGARMPFERARIVELAKSNPAAAIACARSMGVIGSDPVPEAVVAIAKHDPAQAVAEIEAMPSGRSKALSVVALAKTWVRRDPAAALSWVRGQTAGPVKQAALVAAAGALGSEPKRALELVGEAGWTLEGDFHAVHGNVSVIPSEKRDAPDPRRVAADALRIWALRDPQAARRYLAGNVPQDLQDELAREAELTP